MFTRYALRARWLCALFVPTAAAGDWSHYAGDPARSSLSGLAPRLDVVAWSATAQSDEKYVARSSPVAAIGHVFVNARGFSGTTHVSNKIIAYHLFSGQRTWAATIGKDSLDSWSSPAVDRRNKTVLLGSGAKLYAISIADGSIAWQTTLQNPVVNASPVVTTDIKVSGTPANRALISDYDGGFPARLYAINVDPYHASHNPYQPGGIVWSQEIVSSSGNTPAYEDGVVYVASIEGQVWALRAVDGDEVWNVGFDFGEFGEWAGFYGGLSVRNGHVYIAMYGFYGSGNNSLLLKLDARDGALVWDIPSERTDSIPVVTDDGRIFLSAGLPGFGSAVKVQAFEDQGSSATELWDTYVDTSGSLVVGGWTYQPLLFGSRLYVGTPDPNAFFSPYQTLKILDTNLEPGNTRFIVAQHTGSGGSPATACGRLYSLGQNGLYAFGIDAACVADLNGDGVVSQPDLGLLLSAYGSTYGSSSFKAVADLDCDGDVDQADLGLLISALGLSCDLGSG
jgi:outer membrane protein assembly factor BamB